MSTVTLLGALTTTSMMVARSILGPMHVLATIEPDVTGRNNVRCTVLFAGVAPVSVAAEIALPAGTLGFGVANVQGFFFGLTVLERDDAPPL